MKALAPAILLVLGACGKPPSAAADGASSKSAVISKGAAYSPAQYLVPGYVTLLDFYADW